MAVRWPIVDRARGGHPVRDGHGMVGRALRPVAVIDCHRDRRDGEPVGHCCGTAGRRPAGPVRVRPAAPAVRGLPRRADDQRRSRVACPRPAASPDRQASGAAARRRPSGPAACVSRRRSPASSPLPGVGSPEAAGHGEGAVGSRRVAASASCPWRPGPGMWRRGRSRGSAPPGSPRTSRRRSSGRARGRTRRWRAERDAHEPEAGMTRSRASRGA